MNFDIKFEMKKIILNTDSLKNTYIGKYSNTKYTLDLIINEIFYFLKSGVSWRMLRSEINYKTLFWHYSRFVKANIFCRLFSVIRNKYINKYIKNDVSLLIDSTIIYNKNGRNKIGRNKFYKNKEVTKISLMIDINGFPLSVLFMKGNYHDNSVFDKHIRDACILLPKNNKKVMADKAYSSKNNYELLDGKNISHIIPPRKNMKIAKSYTYDKNEYIKRIKIEQMFAKIKNYKRINLRYDKTIRNYSGFVYIALRFIMTNYFNKYL